MWLLFLVLQVWLLLLANRYRCCLLFAQALIAAEPRWA